jgi:hypothetical protein
MRNIFRCLVVCLVFLIAAPSTPAAVVLSTGVNNLANNSTNQQISLFGYSTDPLNNVVGMDLAVQFVGAGTFMNPGITYTSVGSVWNTGGFVGDITGILPGGVNGVTSILSQFPLTPLAISTSSGSPTLLGRFNINTTGVFNVASKIQIVGGGASQFSLDDFTTISFDTTDLNFVVGTPVPVPEPSTMLFFGVGGVAFVVRRLRRKTAVVA